MTPVLFPPNKPIQPDKGLEGGSCNRRACQAPGANFYNIGTDAWYCAPCAEAINHANRMHGTLCFPEKVDRHAKIALLRFGQ